MIVAPEAVIEVKAVFAPIAPVIVMIPALPPIKLRVFAPLIVFEKEMLAPAGELPLFVGSNTILPLKETAPVIPIVAPEVVRLPPRLLVPV